MDWDKIIMLLSVLGAGTIVAGLVSVWVHRRTTRINTEAMAEQGEIQAQQTPLQVLADSLARKDQQMETLVNNHLAHDAAERKAIVSSLERISEGMKSLAVDIQTQRDDAQRRAAKLYEHLEGLSHEFGVVKGQVAILLDRGNRPA